ncbi:hypothetical protein [Streptomyces chartreusis]|uniref:hypothetical protein n=1 Tax=Streptomyces chartreusis TaxID=1969 RepID=UPI002101617D|nr:hypothetical protein [Streptomyces chartreusis]
MTTRAWLAAAVESAAEGRPARTPTTTASALVLLVFVPTSASAATGDCSCRYIGLDGTPQSGTLHDPASPGCSTLPDSWTQRPHGNPATDRLPLRLVFVTGRH